eukprot:scaffold8591_cov20-Tisochrysis_lutea.AAC.1
MLLPPPPLPPAVMMLPLPAKWLSSTGECWGPSAELGPCSLYPRQCLSWFGGGPDGCMLRSWGALAH